MLFFATSFSLCCSQCEQTKGNTGCTKIGVCGKTSQVAILQDLLIYQLKVRGTAILERD